MGDEIEGVQLILENLSKPQLRAREKMLIREMNRRIPDKCRNITHASVTAGVNELSEFVDEAEQRAWLANPAGFNHADDSALKPMSPAQATKYSTAARRFAELPDSTELVESLRTYLENCVPAPRRTEFQSWSVSSGTYGGRRAFCVSVGKMQTFVAGPDGSGFIVVRQSSLTEKYSLRKIMKRHPVVVAKQEEYADAGHDQISLYAGGLAELRRLLSDSDVLRAAGRLTLDVMRKHACVYTRYHCPQLVGLVYGSMQRADADVPTTVVEFDDADAAPTPPKPLPLTEPQAPEGLSTPIEDMTDDVEIYWFVNAGPASTKRNTTAEFLDRGEWRMDPRERYESYVQDMISGERIIVRKRYNPSLHRSMPGTISCPPWTSC
ncbi:hypothetical protein [Gordonia aichiensis]|uniref:hypothetical protein n=1 Tax=Gordonia aichiensis TaxID=36820 RepID=UPI003265752E